MPTTSLRRVRSILTGVAGSPYYLNGYFVQATGTIQQCIDAWSTFVVGATTGTTPGLPTGASMTTEADATIIDPVTDQAIGNESGTARTVTGTSSGPFLPPANQALVRWHTGNYEGGREVRGRTNLPCQLEANSTAGGVLEATAITAFDTRAAALIADANTNFVIYSKKNGLWWSAATGSTWSQFAVLRSRRD